MGRNGIVLVALASCVGAACGDSGGGARDGDDADRWGTEDGPAADGDADDVAVPDEGADEAPDEGTDGEAGDEGAGCPETRIARATRVSTNCKSVDWHYCPDILTEGIITDEDGCGALLPGCFGVSRLDPTDDPIVQDFFTYSDATANPFRLHDGNPSWHPSCEWVVLTALDADVWEALVGDPCRMALQLGGLTAPGRGWLHDLWVFDMTTDPATPYLVADLSDVCAERQAVIHPQFSADGGTLIWAHRLGDEEGDASHEWGQWEIGMGDFAILGGRTPELRNTLSCQPGEQHQFYETHAVSADGGAILYAANQETGQPPTAMDIYSVAMTPDGCGAWTKLTVDEDITEGGGEWDEHAHWSPDGTRIAWMSSEGLHIRYGEGPGCTDPRCQPCDETYTCYDQWAKYLKTELWIMNADGSCPRQLTHFNDMDVRDVFPDFPSHTAQAIVVDSSWSADGRLAMTIMYASEDSETMDSRDLYILEFAE